MAPALLIPVIEKLAQAITGLQNQFSKAMEFADRAQKASLALGVTYEDTKKTLAPTMQGLRGTIDQRFGAAIKGMEAGLQGNTAGIAKLINQQQLTGTAYAATAKSFAALESSLGLSRDQTNVLADNLITTGNKYGISTDKLVEAIDGLRETFPAQDLAGMGDNIINAVTELQAELGPQVAGPLNSVMKTILDTSMDGYGRLVRLGIGDVRERLSAAKNSAEAMEILREAIKTASGNFKNIAGGAEDFYASIGVANKVFGDQIINFTTVAKNFGLRSAKEGQQAADFGETLDNLKKEIFVPFQQGLTNAYPFLVKLANVLSAVIAVVGERFKRWTDGLGDSGETLKNWKLKIVDLAMIVLPKLEGAFQFARKVIEDGVPYIMEQLEKGFYEFFRAGGVLDSLKKSFYEISAALADAMQYLATGDADTRLMQMEADMDKRALELGKVIEKNANNTYENMKKGLAGSSDTTSPLGKIMKEAAAAYSVSNSEQGRMMAGLQKIRDSIVAGTNVAREGNESLEEARARLSSLDDKTKDENKRETLGSEFADQINKSIEDILGIGEDDSASQILEQLQQHTEFYKKQIALAEASVVAANVGISQRQQQIDNKDRAKPKRDD